MIAVAGEPPLAAPATGAAAVTRSVQEFVSIDLPPRPRRSPPPLASGEWIVLPRPTSEALRSAFAAQPAAGQMRRSVQPEQ